MLLQLKWSFKEKDSNETSKDDSITIWKLQIPQSHWEKALIIARIITYRRNLNDFNLEDYLQEEGQLSLFQKPDQLEILRCNIQGINANLKRKSLVMKYWTLEILHRTSMTFKRNTLVRTFNSKHSLAMII